MCRYHGCTRPATCMARLYVPPSNFSNNPQADDCSVMLAGLGLCDTCFSKLTARELLQGERGEAIRAAITDHFRQQRAMPNFDKAVIGRVSPRDHDYRRSQILVEKARAN